MPHFAHFTTNHFSSAIILFSFGLIFFVSINATHDSRQTYLASFKPWANESCIVNSLRALPCPLPKSEKFTYSVTVNVLSTSTPPSDPDAIVAYPTSDKNNCSFASLDAAEAVVEERYAPNKTVPCYISPDKASDIRLTPGGFPPIERNKRRVRFIFSVISTIVLGLIAVFALRRAVMIFALPHRTSPTDPFFSPRRPSMGPGASATYAGFGLGFPTEPPLAGGAPNPASMRRPLSATESRALSASMHIDPADDAHPVDSGAVCPICLEALVTAPPTQLVRLPCTHVYHDECAAQWFRKGSPTCPYCNHTLADELARLREEHQPEPDDSTSTRARRPSGPARRTRQRDSRAQSRDAGAPDDDEDKSADELETASHGNGAAAAAASGAHGSARSRAQSSASMAELAGQRHARRAAADRRRAERDARGGSNLPSRSTGMGDAQA